MKKLYLRSQLVRGGAQAINHLMCTLMYVSRTGLWKIRKFSHILYFLNKLELVHQPKQEVMCQKLLNVHLSLMLYI